MWLNFPGLCIILYISCLIGMFMAAFYEKCDPLKAKFVDDSNQVCHFHLLTIVVVAYPCSFEPTRLASDAMVTFFLFIMNILLWVSLTLRAQRRRFFSRLFGGHNSCLLDQDVVQQPAAGGVIRSFDRVLISINLHTHLYTHSV